MDKKSFDVNKRKNPRVDKKYCVKYYIKDALNQKFDISQIKDISKGGVRFWSTMLLAKDVVLVVELHVPYVDYGVRIEAVVVACEEKMKDLIYEVRLKFINVDQSTNDVLDIIEKRYHQGVG